MGPPEGNRDKTGLAGKLQVELAEEMIALVRSPGNYQPMPVSPYSERNAGVPATIRSLTEH